MRFVGLVATAVLVAAVAAAQPPLHVVATIFPLSDMVRQIGGETVEVTTLLPPGANPHTFEPTPAQIRAAAGARVFIQVGANLDAWAAKALAGNAEVSTVTLTDGVALLGASEHGGDPHVWLDPVLMRDAAVPAIARALTQAGPQHGAAVQQGAAQFQAALSALDAQIHAQLDTAAQRNFVSVHAGWRYFARRYGLHELATLEPFPGKEPSARSIAALVQQARAAQVHALLIEPQFPTRIAEQVAGEFGARVVLVDPLGGPAIPGRDSYVALMRYNCAMFADALR